MRDDPLLVDIFAMVAMSSFLKTSKKKEDPQELAYEAYEQAQAMMKERRLRNSEGDTDE